MRIEKSKETVRKLLNRSDFQTFFSFDISPYVDVRTFGVKEMICHEGGQLPYLYYLVAGKVKIFMSHKNGKISIISFSEAPLLMGEMELLGVEDYTKGVEALTECTCLAIPFDPLRDQLLQDAHFLLRLSIFLGKMVLDHTEEYTKGANYPLENRLAAFILLTQHNGCYLEKHTEVSEYLNISYRHLLYVLSQFCKRGWLRKEGRKYWIGNIEQLSKLSNEIDSY